MPVRISDLTEAAAVIATMEEYDQLGQSEFLATYGFAPSRVYVVEHEGRRAAVRLGATPHDSALSPGVRLLEAIRTVLDSEHQSQIGSSELGRAISEFEAWSTRDPIDVRELAARLRPYDIQPRLLRHGNDVFRGYRHTDFDDAFVCYLEPV